MSTKSTYCSHTVSDHSEGKGEWLYNGERNINTATGGDQKSGALGQSVNVNISFYATGSCLEKLFSVEGPSSSSSHMNLGEAEKDIKETCGAGHARLQMFVQSTWF